MQEELKNKVVVTKFETTSQHGFVKEKLQRHMVEYYNLDMIISIGYRVKSKRGIVFRKWANEILKDYILKNKVLKLKENKRKTLTIANEKISVDEIYLTRGQIDMDKVPTTLLPYLVTDQRKIKFLPYNTLESFYEYTYNEMEDIIQQCSSDANVTFMKKEKLGVSNDCNNFYIYDIINEEGYYRIIEIIPIDKAKGDKYERIRKLRTRRYVDGVIKQYNRWKQESNIMYYNNAKK